MTLRDQMQSKATAWVQTIKSLTNEMIECDKNDTEFKCSGALREYKGRIYATRQIAEMLGIELNTDFNGFAE